MRMPHHDWELCPYPTSHVLDLHALCLYTIYMTDNEWINTYVDRVDLYLSTGLPDRAAPEVGLGRLRALRPTLDCIRHA